MVYRTFFDCRFSPPGMTEEGLIEMAKRCAVKDLAEYIEKNMTFSYDRAAKAVRGELKTGGDHCGPW